MFLVPQIRLSLTGYDTPLTRATRARVLVAEFNSIVSYMITARLHRRVVCGLLLLGLHTLPLCSLVPLAFEKLHLTLLRAFGDTHVDAVTTKVSQFAMLTT